MRIFINGFGRIGRTILRQVLTDPAHSGVEIIGLNDIAAPEMCAYLFQYDSTFGPFPGPVSHGENWLEVAGRRLPLHRADDLRALDLSGVDVVLECTGIARTSDVARRGLEAGAGRVLISGPSPAAETTIVLGGNDDQMGDESILSNASCTTNAIVPLVALLDQLWGVAQGHVTTIHCYTNSQPLVDAPRGSLSRSRAAAQSMVPTSSSALDLIDVILPHLAGRISGAAVRVPTVSVSAIDLVVQTATPLGAEAMLQLEAAVDGHPLIGATDMPLVSSDMRGRPESLVLASPETRLIGAHQVRLFGWYDNEWGFSARMLEMAARMV